MANRLQLRKGTTAQNTAFTGAIGELTYDTEKKQLRVHDGSTVGGKVVDDPTQNVTSQVSNATETTAGKAKIATTAIAQAGVNDTDFLTPKKLRNALNASGDAPVSACRAWLSVNTVTSTILQSFNIASFVKTTTGQFEITFTTPMPHQNYVAFTNNIAVKGGAIASNTVGSTFNATQTNTVSRCYIWCWSTSSGALINPEVLNVGVFC